MYSIEEFILNSNEWLSDSVSGTAFMSTFKKKGGFGDYFTTTWVDYKPDAEGRAEIYVTGQSTGKTYELTYTGKVESFIDNSGLEGVKFTDGASYKDAYKLHHQHDILPQNTQH